MKYKINKKRRKKEKTTKKRWLPKDSNLGAVALEAGHVSTGLTRGVCFCCVINCI
jgi:hypothetical protein